MLEKLKQEQQRLLRNLPRVDTLCAQETFQSYQGPLLTEAVRKVLAQIREAICTGTCRELPTVSEWIAKIDFELQQQTEMHLLPVINGTGIVLHTNLGRAPLSQAAKDAIQEAADYCTLEYDIESGGRGSRQAHVEGLLCELIGAQAALVVNNNAAAMLLAISTLAKGKEVVVSRGELVEIGGSFRIPEVLEEGGAQLREVGTTNRTRLGDYIQAVGPQTAALLKVHTSNYRVVGFTESVKLEALCQLGKQLHLPVIADLGSGLMMKLWDTQEEPVISEVVKMGVDVAAFSGDKLLGGPQAGILVGRRVWIDRMRKHPLLRAVRMDKLGLAALEATLRLYLDPHKAKAQLPVLAMLTAKPEELYQKAQQLAEQIGFLPEATVLVEPVNGYAGGGAFPERKFPSWAVAIQLKNGSALWLEEQLRRLQRPVLGRIHRDRLLLDVRTIPMEAFAYLATELQSLLRSAPFHAGKTGVSR